MQAIHHASVQKKGSHWLGGLIPNTASLNKMCLDSHPQSPFIITATCWYSGRLECSAMLSLISSLCPRVRHNFLSLPFNGKQFIMCNNLKKYLSHAQLYARLWIRKSIYFSLFPSHSCHKTIHLWFWTCGSLFRNSLLQFCRDVKFNQHKGPKSKKQSNLAILTSS